MKILQTYQKIANSFVNVRENLIRNISDLNVSDAVKTEFSVKILPPLISYVIAVIQSGIFISYAAETFEEFAEGVYVFSSVMSIMIDYICQVIFVRANIFVLIEQFEALIEKRKIIRSSMERFFPKRFFDFFLPSNFWLQLVPNMPKRDKKWELPLDYRLAHSTILCVKYKVKYTPIGVNTLEYRSNGNISANVRQAK